MDEPSSAQAPSPPPPAAAAALGPPGKPKRSRRRAALVALVLAVVLGASGIAGWVVLTSPSTDGTARLLLNEIMFHPGPGPGPGIAPFVELKNAGAAPASLAGVALKNEAGTVYNLPGGLVPVPPGGLQLIAFDGGNNIGGGIVHADRTAFLAQDSGFLLLGQD